MKNVSSIKASSNHESPKTPGGISKSLLTPCRRVGLSRNWKKKGPSPFISPLTSNASNNVEVTEPKKENRKRKSTVEAEEKTNEIDENIAVCSVEKEGENSANSTNADEIVKTPLRNVIIPRRKKSKTFLATLNTPASAIATNSTVSHEIDDCTKENETTDDTIDNDINLGSSIIEKVSDVVNKDVSPPLEPSEKVNINKRKKFHSPLKTPSKITSHTKNTIPAKETIEETPKEVSEPMKKKSESKTKTRSPNELTKECIVVIQRKLLKVKEKYEKNDLKKNSQTLFDSDDEAPLSTLNKKDIKMNKPPLTLGDDDDFIETPSTNKNKKLEPKKTSKDKPKTQTAKIPATVSKPPSQSSFEDDDDFFDKKKTILIRKTYDKLSKPNKAKSTGSISQTDIDNIKARIDVKKKMLLAKSMTADTEELRDLIKKWQKGCQEALVELMDMMRLKCPDKHSMDYSEILQILKIPPALVGYDSDHDCFNTPDDSSAVLSKYNDF